MDFRVVPNLFFVWFAFGGLIGPQVAQAQDPLPHEFTIQGRLYAEVSGQTVPLDRNDVDIKLELLAEDNVDCVLYDEEFLGVHLNSTENSSKGVFSLRLGAGTALTNPKPSFVTLFSPGSLQGHVRGTTNTCAVDATAGMRRLVRTFVKVSPGSYEALTPDTRLTAVPSALVAQDASTLQGYGTAAFLMTNTSVTQSKINDVFDKYSRLMNMLSTDSPFLNLPTGTVNMNGATLTNLASPGTSPGDAVNKGYADAHIGGKNVDLSAVSDGKVMMWDQNAQTWKAMDSLVIGRNVASVTSANHGQVLKWNAFGGGQWQPSVDLGITQLKGDVLTAAYGTGVQTATIGTAAVTNEKIADNAITSVKLSSSGVAVNRLLITDALNGSSLRYMNCTAENQTLLWTSTGWTCSLKAAVTSINSKTGDITLNAGDIVGLDYGTAPGQLPQLVGTGALGKLPAVDGSQLLNVSAAQLQGRPVANTDPVASQVLTWNGSVWWPTALPSAVSRIVASTGLLGGTITSSGTLQVDVGTAASKIPQLNANAQLVLASGSATNPAYSFANDGSSGMFLKGSGQIGISTGGSESLVISGTNLIGSNNTVLGAGYVNSMLFGSSNGVNSSSGGAIRILGSSNSVSRARDSASSNVNIVGHSNTVDMGSSGSAVVAAFGIGNSISLPTNGAVAQAVVLGISATAADGQVVVGRYPNLITFTSANSYFSGGGNVGIGTTSPGQKLSVAGTIQSTSGGIMFPDGTTQTTASTDAGTWTRSGALVYYSGGNVGIGTTTPSSKLQIQGNVQIPRGNGVSFNDDTLNAGMRLDNAPSWLLGTDNVMTFTNSGNTSINGAWVFRDTLSATNIMTIRGMGNVGIGTPTPQVRLEIQGTGPQSAMIVPRDTGANRPTGVNGMIRYNTSTASLEAFANNTWVSLAGAAGSFLPLSGGTMTGAVLYPASGSASAPSISFAGSQSTGIFSPSSNNISIAAQGTSALNITGSNGNVGIGTTTPSQRLSVAGTIQSTSGGIMFPDGTTQATASADAGTWTRSGALVYYNGGNVGIGTQTPAQPLDVTGNIKGSRFFSGSGNAGAPGLSFNSDSDNGIYLPAGGNALGFSTAGLDAMRIDGAGNVGIGTTSPSSRLTVNGTVEITGTGQGIKFADGSTQSTSYGVTVNNVTATSTTTALTLPIPKTGSSLQNLILSSSPQITIPVGGFLGQTMITNICQDGTGGRTPTFVPDSGVTLKMTFPAGWPTTTGGKCDICGWVYYMDRAWMLTGCNLNQ